MSVMSKKTVWAMQLLIERHRDEADDAVEAITRAVCADEDHPGYCRVLDDRPAQAGMISTAKSGSLVRSFAESNNGPGR